MNNGIKLTPIIIAELASGYKSGTDTTELAKKYSISKATVCRGLRKAGIEPERRDNLFTDRVTTETEKNSIILDFKSGSSIKELCHKYDTSYPTIVKLLGAEGLWIKKKVNRFKLPTETITTTFVKMKENVVKKILNAVDQTQVCEMYIDGPFSKEQLAEEFQVHVDTISAILRRNSIATKKYVPQEIIDQFTEEYKQGNCTPADLAKIYKLNPDTIRYWLTKAGLLDTTIVGNPDPTKSPGVTAGSLRKLARENSEAAMQTLLDIMNDPAVRERERITAAQLVMDRAFGKPKDEKEEDTSEPQSKAARLLSLVPKGTLEKLATKK
jgi:Mor family transcriptional regulator